MAITLTEWTRLKVFIEKVELNKELVRVVINEVLEMIINMINDEFKKKEHNIAKKVKEAKNLHNAGITLEESKQDKAVIEDKVNNGDVIQGVFQGQGVDGGEVHSS